MLTQIDALTGQGLMRLWGVPSFPLVDGDHLLWNSVGIFVCMDFGDHVDLHMAMMPKARHWCRDAVADVMALIGNREVHAPIRIEHKRVCNLARKFGFIETWRGVVEYIDGTSGELILMKRHVR
ncbi:hypothetical protein ABRP77_07945 [Pectobacterium odoriferum]|uniref:hypothetical protein n=1 Tax=Pectobacterium TaxID=122277 RepID=UPI000CE69999|nr:hypothetical protein [Pectobacterium brasiliense]PPE57091.1 hypothetical protein F152LOC_04139 [Pectobacterium brasiliense]